MAAFTGRHGAPVRAAGDAWLPMAAEGMIHAQGRNSELRKAVGPDWKGKISIVAYISAIVLALVDARLPLTIYVLIALLWLIPDRRIEKRVRDEP